MREGEDVCDGVRWKMNGKGSRCRIGNYAKYWENIESVVFALKVTCEWCGHECRSKSAVPVCSKCGKTVFKPRKKGQRMAALRFGKRDERGEQ